MSIKLTTLDHFTMLAARCKLELNKLETKIPTNVSQLTNDANYQTDTEVQNAINSAGVLSRKTVDGISDIDPTAPDAQQYIYMIHADDGVDNDRYNEYMVIGGKIELIGNTRIDLSSYLQDSDAATDLEVDAVLNSVFATTAA